ILIGATQYRLVAVEREGRWVAHAERVDTSERFGIDCEGETNDDAIDALRDWLAWQHEHAAALEALQVAERSYHQTVAAAFAEPGEGVSAGELQQEALDALSEARSRLDEIRARKPL